MAVRALGPKSRAGLRAKPELDEIAFVSVSHLQAPGIIHTRLETHASGNTINSDEQPNGDNISRYTIPLVSEGKDAQQKHGRTKEFREER